MNANGNSRTGWRVEERAVCNACNKSFLRKNAKRHVQSCRFNTDARACDTCAHQLRWPKCGCALGVELEITRVYDEWGACESRVHSVLQCAEWAPQLDVGE